MTNPRGCIANIVHEVAFHHHSLDDAFAQHLKTVTSDQHAFIKAACFGSLRFYYRLKALLNQLLDKPIKKKEALVETVLICALHECLYMQTPSHACVSENVNAIVALNKGWAKGLCNAILRKVLREDDLLENIMAQDKIARYAHPGWFIRAIEKHYPQQADAIFNANNQAGPLTLRINRQRVTRESYLQTLTTQAIDAQLTTYSPDGITITNATDVTQLPGYDEGWFSVQDEAAQLAATLLKPGDGERILDACAAPGGKTSHLLELAPQSDLVALDESTSRLQRVQQNLTRLGHTATVITGDARQPATWWDKQPFDRILLDAPCSASGVIRRHPDIKLLRRAEDIPRLVKTQSQILASLWPLLKSGGMLLYATCSVLAEENVQQIQQFVAEYRDARYEPINADWGHACPVGRQILPGQDDMDGFYYATIYKCD